MQVPLTPSLLDRLRAWNHVRLQRRRAIRTDRTGEGSDYTRWVREYDTVDSAMRERLHMRAQSLPSRPLISVLMPVYDPNPAWLSAAIDSVRAQVYENWELCIADDRSTDPAIYAILQRYQRMDARIRIAFREENGHISAASNSALALARGGYVALLDHDDLLPEQALLFVAEAIARFPDADVLYSDEDKIDADNRRCAPYFKCDWNLELFRSQNLISHLGVYRAELVRAVGGFRRGYEGSQDYDLALRCVEQTTPARIIHIPHVLYHWRVHAQSTAQASGAKPYAQRAGRRALEDHFARSGIACDVDAKEGGWYRCDYRLPQPVPAVTAVVVDSGSEKRLRQCIAALRGNTTYPRFEIVVAFAEDGSTLADACNRAIAATRDAVIAIVDSRCRFESDDWLRRLVARACLPGAGAVGAKLLSRNGRIVGNGQLLGVRGAYAALGLGTRAGRGGYFGRARLAQHVAALGDGCVVARREHIQHVGWLDPTFHDMGAALVDLTFRFNAYGLHNHWAPEVEAVLAPQGLGRRRVAAKEAKRVAQRWGFTDLRDAHYNDNLGRATGEFQLAHPPRVTLLRPWFEPMSEVRREADGQGVFLAESLRNRLSRGFRDF
jgi:glycosyltransferase involved in cell wall biosynthesis